MIQAIALLPVVFIVWYHTLVGGGWEYRIEMLQGFTYPNFIHTWTISTFPSQPSIVTSTSYTPNFCACGPIFVACSVSCHPAKSYLFSFQTCYPTESGPIVYNSGGDGGKPAVLAKEIVGVFDCGVDIHFSMFGRVFSKNFFVEKNGFQFGLHLSSVQSRGPGQERADIFKCHGGKSSPENGGKWSSLVVVSNKSASRYCQPHTSKNVSELRQAGFNCHPSGSHMSFFNTNIHKSPGSDGPDRANVQSCVPGLELADLHHVGGYFVQSLAVLNKDAARCCRSLGVVWDDDMCEMKQATFCATLTNRVSVKNLWEIQRYMASELLTLFNGVEWGCGKSKNHSY